MKAPISFVCGNCVFGERLDDVWAAFAVSCSPYEWLSHAQKRSRMLSIAAALEALAADVEVVRVASGWQRAPYLRHLRHHHTAGPHPEAARHYAVEHERHTARLGLTRVSLFVMVSLRDPRQDLASSLARVFERRPREWLGALVGARSVRERVPSAATLERAALGAQRVYARLRDFLPVRPAHSTELHWLVRRSFCRGLEVPSLEEGEASRQERASEGSKGPARRRGGAPGRGPRERGGDACVTALGARLERLIDARVQERTRCLRIESELGESWQAHLVLGALPDRAVFPGARSELMFAPVESLPFPVDLSLSARYIPNELALRMARRRVQDADQIASAESDGEQGVSDVAYQRTLLARELLAHLQSASHPPLLRATLAVAVGAGSEEQLAERVEACRRAYGEVSLYRPLGEQLRLFAAHLPGQRSRVSGYEDILTVEQVAAMMPTATHAVGSRGGFYLGHTLSGSRKPVRFNLREGSESDRNTTILSVGALGSGKTTLAQKLQYEAFLTGARVIDCDPKGDHRFHLLDAVAPHVETIALRPEARLRGMLDPLRIAPAHLRREAAVSFLCDLLPSRSEPLWETAVLSAVERVMRRCKAPCCSEVVRALLAGENTGRQVGMALEVYAGSGITQLGFGDPAHTVALLGERQVTYIPIRDLPAPDPRARRSEYTHAERVGQQIVRLIAMLAMQLISMEPGRLKLFAFDEGWRLLGDPVGRSLLLSLQRMGRSELAVPLVSTQLVSDALIDGRESLENLVGATFVFGMRSPAEASRALALLGIDPDAQEGNGEDRRSAQRLLLELCAGRCLMRDHAGRVEAVQVELVSRCLSRAFSTTPPAHPPAPPASSSGLPAHPPAPPTSLSGLFARPSAPPARRSGLPAHPSAPPGART